MVAYVDSSVLLAAIRREPRLPPKDFWDGALVSSRLLDYEVVVRLNAYGATREQHRDAAAALRRVNMSPLQSDVLERALTPFPIAVRTLDALHLATAEHIRRGRPSLTLASYDRRLLEAAAAIGIPIYGLP